MITAVSYVHIAVSELTRSLYTFTNVNLHFQLTHTLCTMHTISYQKTDKTIQLQLAVKQNVTPFRSDGGSHHQEYDPMPILLRYSHKQEVLLLQKQPQDL